MPAIPGFIVPFTDWEWNRAKFLFRSTSVSEIRECLSLLSMWRSRMGDKTPVAISCSDLLLRVAMDELLTKDKSDWIRMEAIKMSYCIAIIRRFTASLGR
ncbi:unnamed protein product [Caenorhabditis auriculariae]|uniref:Uncharacterized protein n=1 Tax=Caenorhabditis auriculariae TaxID=2777116 RepID=A0A8S1GP78_9PELO|nr:unnamed protein product [Caenorhabditis auriculariae]